MTPDDPIFYAMFRYGVLILIGIWAAKKGIVKYAPWWRKKEKQ